MPSDNGPAAGLVAQFACPVCRGPVEGLSESAVGCVRDGLRFERRDGIWRFLPPDRATHYDRFIREYGAIRRAERRGSADDGYYRALPFKDTTGVRRSDWRIRAASFRSFARAVLKPIEAEAHRPLRILDLGAGNGWLSYRLARRGHSVAALDLAVNEEDGLGAQAHYDVSFLAVQAEYDRAPFARGVFDLAVFNASFHYSTDYDATLAEALRVLTPPGGLVILDTPVYHDAASGVKMVEERRAQFRLAYGYPSDALPSEEFLTHARLEELGAAHGLRWRLIRPFFGVGWAARPVAARLRGHREPAGFFVIAGSRPATGTTELSDISSSQSQSR